MKFKWILLIAMSLLLQACVNAAVTGAGAVYDRHNLSKKFNDNYITMKAYRTIYLDTDEFKDTDVKIETFNNSILLTGQASTKELKDRLVSKINEIPNVEKVYNFINTSPDQSALTKASDAWITSKITANLITSNDIDPSLIKVTTSRGTVFLMGIVPPEAAEIAVDIATNTNGVQNVVKIFKYIRISST